MAKVKDKWRPADGICPTCFEEVKCVAIRHRRGWEVRGRCECRKINDLHPWPFEENIFVPLGSDFRELGMLTEWGPYYYETYRDQTDDLLREQEEYLKEVDYGWELSHQ